MVASDELLDELRPSTCPHRPRGVHGVTTAEAAAEELRQDRLHLQGDAVKSQDPGRAA